jgi:hypothetical protein
LEEKDIRVNVSISNRPGKLDNIERQGHVERRRIGQWNRFTLLDVCIKWVIET